MSIEDFRSNRIIRALINIKKGLPYQGAPKISTAVDYFWCSLFGYSYDEYFFMHKLYAMDYRTRKTYISNHETHVIEAKINGTKRIEEFRNKAVFNSIFADFIKRKWVFVPEINFNDFQNYLGEVTTDYLICKPSDSSMGRGVFRVSTEEARKKSSSLFNELSCKQYIVEECIVACDEISSLHPSSLNTIRVTTLNQNGKIDVLWSFIRIGNNNSVVDNGHSGGIWAMIDLKTGIIYSQGMGIDGLRYDFHPMTGKQIKGFSVPNFSEVIDVATRAAAFYPTAKIVGWDLAVCLDGTIEIIEGNSKPDVDMVQAADCQGRRELMKNILKPKVIAPQY